VNDELETIWKEAVVTCIIAAFVSIIEARSSRLRGMSADTQPMLRILIY
jgi:hypothetical protein